VCVCVCVFYFLFLGMFVVCVFCEYEILGMIINVYLEVFFFFFFLTNNMCYYILLKVPGQGQKQEV